METWVFVGLAAVFTPTLNDQYEFIENTHRFVAIERGEDLLIGKLDRAGNFLPDMRFLGLRKGQLVSGPPFQVINFYRPARDKVYEYRSNRLIRGELDMDGNFIPDLGSNVIDFKDYRPGKGVPVIYNLPGRFVKKDEAKKPEPKKEDGK